MQLAVSSILIFLIILPGIIFRYFYLKGNWKSPVFYLYNLTYEITYGITIALAIHIIIYLSLKLTTWNYDFNIIIPVLFGNLNDDHLSLISSNFSKNFYCILIYFIVIDGFSAIAGYISHLIVRKLKVDIKFSLFRFNNEWYYHFSGESQLIDYFSDMRFCEKLKVGIKKIEEVLSTTYVFVAIVVNHGCGTYLYRGILQDYYYNKEGQLERIVLQQALRRALVNDRNIDCCESDPENDDRFYHIKGDFLIINYSDIVTMNVDYRFVISPPECENTNDNTGHIKKSC